MSGDFQQVKKILLSLLGVVFTLAGLFFCQFIFRMVYRNLVFTGTEEHHSTWTYIWAVFFPAATIVFGVLSWLCFRQTRRLGSKTNDKKV